jgi:hypothetical protein
MAAWVVEVTGCGVVVEEAQGATVVQLCQPSLIYYSFNEEKRIKDNNGLAGNHYLRLTLLYGYQFPSFGLNSSGDPRRY